MQSMKRNIWWSVSLAGDDNLIVKRGDVFFADLSPVVGSEQGGTRPVLIIQNDIGNRLARRLSSLQLLRKFKKQSYLRMLKLTRKSTASSVIR